MSPPDKNFPQFLRSFIPEFLQLFFPEWASRLDLASTEWMKPEQLPRVSGEPTTANSLVAKVQIRSSPDKTPDQGVSPHHPDGTPSQIAECFLVFYFDFTEDGSSSTDPEASLERRVPTHHLQLHQQTGLPVLPLVVFGKAKGDCLGVLSWRESFFDLETQVVRCLYVALKGLRGVDYLATGNPIGAALATLMAIAPDKVAWLGAEALRLVCRSSRTDAEKFLLGEFIQANLPLDNSQKQAFEDLLATETYAEVATMNKTVYEKGIREGLVSAVLASLEGRFDSVPPDTSARIASLDQPGLLSLLKAIPRADLIEDLPPFEDLSLED